MLCEIDDASPVEAEKKQQAEQEDMFMEEDAPDVSNAARSEVWEPGSGGDRDGVSEKLMCST